MVARVALVVAASFAWLPPTQPGLTGQRGSRPADLLAAIETLAATGRTAEARRELAEWWTEQRSDAHVRVAARALWLRGRLATDPAEAARDFRRLLAEFPSSPYADLALLRLAQGARAAGDPEAEIRYLESLARAYPGSPGHKASLAWARGEEVRLGAQLDILTQGQAITTVLSATADSPSDTLGGAGEAAGGEAAGGEAADGAAAGDELDPPPSEPEATEEASPLPLRYSVQLGAFREIARAQSVERRAKESGLEVRIARLPDSQLLYVRVGRFVSQAEANELQARLTDLGFRTFVVRDADEERPAG